MLAHESDFWIPGPPLAQVPRWSNGHIVGCDPCRSRAPIIWSISKDGRRDEVALDFRGAGYIDATDVASAPDGALVVVGHAISDDSRIARYIAWISPDRKRQIVTRLGTFSPGVVTVALDGTIWVVGSVKSDDNQEFLKFSVLRHYEPSGRLLATTDVATRGLAGSIQVYMPSNLMASSDRIGWLTHACEYIEFSMSGNEIGRYPCPNGILDSRKLDGVALSSENEVLLGGKRSGPFAPVELDRAKRSWLPVATDLVRPWHWMLGFDGATLVTFPGDGSIRRFNRITVAR